MLTKPKQIVIDKDVLISTKLEDLCAFTRDHNLILCDTLWYECATTTGKQDARNLTNKCKRLVERGAYICSGNHVHFLQWEGKHCHPYPPCLLDLDATTAVRSEQVRCDEMADSWEAKEARQSRYTIAEHLLLEPSKDLKALLDCDHPAVVKVLKKFQGNPAERFRVVMERVDKSDIYETGVKTIPKEWITDTKRFCLSSEWISWHYVRLTAAMIFECYHLRQAGYTPSQERAEHDLQDMEYVLLLSRADGIITKDKKLVEPLARAAFPEKRVFSSLKEVPEAYRCDRAD